MNWGRPFPEASTCALTLPRKLRMLWLEDAEPVREVIEMVLAQSELRETLEIQWVEDGDVAWQKLQESPPDVFGTDMEHPGLNGYTLVRRLAEAQATVPVLVLSGFSNEAAKNNFIKFCAQACAALNVTVVTKPFGLDELVAALELVCKRASG